jgi:hypothetical protein
MNNLGKTFTFNDENIQIMFIADNTIFDNSM